MSRCGLEPQITNSACIHTQSSSLLKSSDDPLWNQLAFKFGPGFQHLPRQDKNESLRVAIAIAKQEKGNAPSIEEILFLVIEDYDPFDIRGEVHTLQHQKGLLLKRGHVLDEIIFHETYAVSSPLARPPSLCFKDPICPFFVHTGFHKERPD